MTATGTHSPRLLTDWDATKTAAFQKEVLTFAHDIEASGLFTDEALIALLERHPASETDVCTMSEAGGPYPNKFRTGDFREADGKTLLAAVHAGAVWINLRKAMNIHPEYTALLDRMYGELSSVTGNKAFNARGGILISSPIAKVPYHTDKTETILWHVRGQKRLLVYPRTQDFMPDRAYEATLTDLLDDDLPYDPSMDASATVLDLEPGQAASWPLNSPHRVVNKTFCVSVTTEYSTRESAIKNSAMLTNAMLRARFGMDPSYSRDGAVKRRVKSLTGRALHKAGLTPNTSSEDYVTFKVDPKADGFLVDTDPYVRDF